MTPDDLTTPLDGLASHDLPTINRAAPGPARNIGGLTPGAIVGGRYRIVALLGRGGMGEVYRADDLRLGQTVALKFVDLGSDARSIENLYHEVRVARQVSHPNVCRVHDVVETEGHRFIAMEYVDGEDLASLLRRIGRLPPTRATDVAREIASGLAAAHERGIVHRDLKPANVMLDGNGRAHVTDFGLASLAGTESGQIAGTPAYMAPEQVLGQPVTPRTDVYALGLLMHELFTGERVYSSASYAERRQQRFLSPRPASDSVKEIEPAIDAVIAACLAEDPAGRPASARVVLSMLPGGDAIDAAMAAGETPSPEMIAAASETGELSAKVAWSVCAAVVIALLVAAWQMNRSLVTLMRRPPEVLADRAEEMLARFGETTEARDVVYFHDHDRGLIRSPARLLPRAQFDAIRPGVLRFVYRRSPSRMAPRETIQAANDVFIFQGGRVTFTDPELAIPGDAIVILDHHRSLVSYRARPSGRAASPDWRPLLEATGIDMRTLVQTDAVETPAVPADNQVAWTAAYPGQAGRVRIEAASLHGRPAWLQVFPSWEGARRSAPSTGPTGVILAVQFVITIGITIMAIVVTRRSLRRGRSDRTGAFRLALYIAGCLTASWLVAAHHATDVVDEARILASNVGQTLAAGVLVWFFYIALEPGVRRTWPRALIGWTRILAGRFRDPMVGREVILGLAGGMVAYGVFWITAIIRTRVGYPTSFFANASAIDPLGVFAGNHLISHVMMIEIPIGMIFTYLLLRNLLGRVGGMIAVTALVSGYSVISPATSIFMLLLLFAILRSGLLTGVVMGATVSLLLSTLLTLDTAAWYWPRALVVMLITAGTAAWAARTATRGHLFP